MKFLILQHIGCEHPGLLGDFLKEKGIGYDIVPLYLGQAIPDLNPYRALVVLGGPMNVYEEEKYPFLVDEHQAIKEAVQKNMPVLGFCLGGQLLAKALGARVSPNPVKEVGFYTVSLTEEGAKDKLFQGCDSEFTVFQWHGDRFDIPQGAARLASSPLCPNQAFCYGDHAYALQFHVEVTPDMVATWAKEYRDELEELHMLGEVPSLVTEAHRRLSSSNQVARQIFSNFLGIVSANKY